MINGIKKALAAAGQQGLNVPEFFARLFNRLFTRQVLTSGGVAIQGAASAGAKTVNAILSVFDGRLVSVAAGNLPALTGYNLTANQYGVVLYTVDASGAFAVYFGQPASSLAGVVLPDIPEVNPATGTPQAACAMLVLANGASAFTGGTTALDSITTTYVNIVGTQVPTPAF